MAIINWKLIKEKMKSNESVSIGDLVQMGVGNGYSGEHLTQPNYDRLWKGTVVMFLGIRGLAHYFLHKGKVIWTNGPHANYKKYSAPTD